MVQAAGVIKVNPGNEVQLNFKWTRVAKKAKQLTNDKGSVTPVLTVSYRSIASWIAADRQR